jgi:hypothetical protein
MQYVEGHIGSCCEDHASHEMDPGHIALGMLDDERGASYLREQELRVNYYGVVAQSSAEQSLEGCYLMKTVQQIGAGCHCMHYSFMRVCSGPSLRDQAVDHWL